MSDNRKDFDCEHHDAGCWCNLCAMAAMDAELTELRAVLAAMGAEKRDGVWTVPGCECGYDCNKSPVCEACGAPEVVPIPNLAPVAGGSHE